VVLYFLFNSFFLLEGQRTSEREPRFHSLAGFGEDCFADMIRLVQYGAGITSSLDCPKQMVGRVIGKGGETIKGLQKQFGVNIQIDQAVEPNKITVAGAQTAVAAAIATVQEIINGGNPLAAQPAAAGSFPGAGRGAPMAFPGVYQARGPLCVLKGGQPVSGTDP
jgi:polyribonucleotide nucleotidyltransferase